MTPHSTDTRPRIAPDSKPADEPQPEHRRRRWPWIAVVVGGVLAYLVFRGAHKTPAGDGSAAGPAKGQAAARAIPVVAATSRTGDLGVYLNGLGTVTPLSTVTVRSRVDGQLMNVSFKEGQLVQKGDLLAEIDPRPFQVQLTQAEGQAAKDRATLENAKLDLQRYQTLMAQDAIPRQVLDTQKATVAQSEAVLESDQGQIDAAKLNLAYSRITAPITGTIGLRLVDAGNMVHAADANGLLVITQLQPINVVFTIAADALPVVQKQMRAGGPLPVEAWDRDLKNKLASGTLSAIDNQIDQTTGTVRLKAIFPNTDNALFPNQFVNARLLVDTLHAVVLLPVAALQRTTQSTYVYVIKPDDSVEMRPVEVRLTEGNEAAIAKGLAGGERVVTDGVDKLQPGSKVSVGGPESAGAGAAGAADATPTPKAR
jgi:multidrug efflux system membrane fusion protein